jgi:hypothetical protein
MIYIQGKKIGSHNKKYIISVFAEMIDSNYIELEKRSIIAVNSSACVNIESVDSREWIEVDENLNPIAVDSKKSEKKNASQVGTTSKKKETQISNWDDIRKDFNVVSKKTKEQVKKTVDVVKRKTTSKKDQNVAKEKNDVKKSNNVGSISPKNNKIKKVTSREKQKNILILIVIFSSFLLLFLNYKKKKEKF